MIDFIRSIKRFFRNLWDYKRFLWENNWWDSYYIFYSLREKLRVDVKYYKKYGIHLYVQKDIDRMEFCIKLLNRIINDEYLNNALLFFEKEYPNWLDYALTDKCKYDKKWFRRCSKNSDRQKQQDINYLFKYIGKHIQEFWD